jgi:heme exporter protein CcmD
MNQWSFVVAAYAVAVVAIAALLAWSYASMKRAEAEADKLRPRE